MFIPRRDSSSRFNALVGGRLFPGVHHHARFLVRESAERYHIALDSDDGQTHLLIDGRLASELPATSGFSSLAAASDFFKRGALGYSVTRTPGEFDGLELRTFTWQVQPLAVEKVESSFFDDRKAFPGGSVEFDCVLLMRGIEHDWIGRESLCTFISLPPPANPRECASAEPCR